MQEFKNKGKNLVKETISRFILLFFLPTIQGCSLSLPFVKCRSEIPIPNYSIRNIPHRDKSGKIKIAKDHTFMIRLSGKCK